MDWLEIILTAGVFIVFIAGLAGLLLPVIPGIPLIWLGTVVYAVLTGFAKIGWGDLAVFTGLTLFSVVVDYTANIIGARKFGASRWGIIGAFLGLAAGLMTAGPVGLILGPLAGAVIGELLSGKSGSRALKSGFGALVGLLAGVVVKLAIGLTMIGIFVWRIL